MYNCIPNIIKTSYKCILSEIAWFVLSGAPIMRQIRKSRIKSIVPSSDYYRTYFFFFLSFRLILIFPLKNPTNFSKYTNKFRSLKDKVITNQGRSRVLYVDGLFTTVQTTIKCINTDKAT